MERLRSTTTERHLILSMSLPSLQLRCWPRPPNIAFSSQSKVHASFLHKWPRRSRHPLENLSDTCAFLAMIICLPSLRRATANIPPGVISPPGCLAYSCNWDAQESRRVFQIQSCDGGPKSVPCIFDRTLVLDITHRVWRLQTFYVYENNTSSFAVCFVESHAIADTETTSGFLILAHF